MSRQMVMGDEELERIERSIRRQLLCRRVNEKLSARELATIADTDMATVLGIVRGLHRAGVVFWRYEGGWALTARGLAEERARMGGS